LKALIWVIALVLAIPTFGISLAIAVVITIHLNKQEQMAAAQVFVSAASTLRNDVVNKYDRLRMRERLPSTQQSDSDIFEAVMKFSTLIEVALKKSGRFHDDKEEIIQLAVRFTSYAENFESGVFTQAVEDELEYVTDKGVVAALRKSYLKKNRLLVSDDEIPF
jgi:hypothetical protein